MSKSCYVCGKDGEPGQQSHPITEDLVVSWKLDGFYVKYFSKREGLHCSRCENSNRTITLAKAIAGHYKQKSFKAFIHYANRNELKVAEVNGAGKLHSQLTKIKGLRYSEYNLSRKKDDPRHEDITNLSYKSNSFDLLIHSETLEHIPYPEKATQEVLRVLKPGGICIFTIPIIMTRKTEKRFTEGKIGRKLKQDKSHHGYGREDCVVWWEYGYDFADFLGKQAELLYSRPYRGEYVFCIAKQPSKIRVRSVRYAKFIESTRRLFRL